MRTRFALVSVPVLAAAAVLGACSSDGEQVADEINDKLAEALDVDADDITTTCPDDAEAGEGEEFDCDIEIDGQTITASITFEDDEKFEFIVNGNVFDKDELEAQLKGELAEGLGAEVTELDCPGDTLVAIPSDDTIECDGSDADGGSGTALVGLDEDGNAVIVDVEN